MRYGTGYVTTNWNKMALYGVKRGFGTVSAAVVAPPPLPVVPPLKAVVKAAPKSAVNLSALVTRWNKVGRVAA